MVRDIINEKFGELTVIESLGKQIYNSKNGKKQEKFKCLCSCGDFCDRWRDQLISGQVTKCKNRKNHLLEKPRRDITGRVFGQLKVLKFSHYDREKSIKQYWLCKCKCGNQKAIVINSLDNGDSKSCGCLEKESLKKINKAFKDKYQLPKNVASFNNLYYKYKICAKQRNIIFLLTRKESEVLFLGNCYYCGQKPNRLHDNKRKFNGNPLVNGIDRKDNNAGYTIENCVSCCKICNYAKRDLSEKEFNQWIKQLIKYNTEDQIDESY